MAYERELDAALSWVEECDRIAMRHFRVGVPTERKADGTPVTVADRAIESYLREQIGSAFPGDAIVGEEEGAVGDAPRRWVIDPIDGTKSYARGIPLFGILIGFGDAEHEHAVGVASSPGIGARWWGSAGAGAFHNGEPISVSDVSSFSDAHVATGGFDWAQRRGYGDAAMQIVAACARHRGYGDFYGSVLVAQGSMDAMVEFAPLAVWDRAAPNAIVEAAGGRSTTLPASDGVGPTVTTNGRLHGHLLSLLGV